MDNKSLNQTFLDEEVMDDDEFSRIFQFYKNEALENNKMQINAFIQSLEDEGMVNNQFRSIYLSSKKDEAPSFFRKLVCGFFNDARIVIRNLTTTLESSSDVDFDFLYMHCNKLKGSSSSIGACTLVNGCYVFIQAVDNKSKDECLQAAKNLKQAYNKLHTKLKSLMKVEKKIVAAEEKALGQK